MSRNSLLETGVNSKVLESRCSHLDCNETRDHNHLVHKQTLNHLAKLANLAKWLSVRLRTKWLWVRVLLQSHKNQWRQKSKTDTSIKIDIKFVKILCFKGSLKKQKE